MSNKARQRQGKLHLPAHSNAGLVFLLCPFIPDISSETGSACEVNPRLRSQEAGVQGVWVQHHCETRHGSAHEGAQERAD